MRSKNINSDGSGNGSSSDFINRILERFKELQFYSTATVTVEQTTRGTRFHAKPQRGGSAGVSGWHKPLNKKYEVDPTYSYDEGSVIHIQSGNALVTTGIRDAANPTGPLVISKSGYWVSTQDVPPETTVSAHLVWNLPQFPMPVPGDIDDTTNFWIYLGDIYC